MTGPMPTRREFARLDYARLDYARRDFARRDFAEILRAPEVAYATDGAPIATPATWVPGQDVSVTLSLNVEQAAARYSALDITLPCLGFARQPGGRAGPLP